MCTVSFQCLNILEVIQNTQEIKRMLFNWRKQDKNANFRGSPLFQIILFFVVVVFFFLEVRYASLG